MDLFGLSLCWLFCSLPVITIGAASTALYDAVYHGVRRDESGDYVRFFKTFWRELKPSTLVFLPMLLLYILFTLLLHMAYSMAMAGSQVAGVLVYVYQVIFCVPLAVWLFSCAALSRFTFSPVALIKTACSLVFAHLPSAILVVVIINLAKKIILFWPISMIFLPAIAVWLCTFPMERIFAPFLAAENAGPEPTE